MSAMEFNALRRDAERTLRDIFLTDASPDARQAAALALGELGVASADIVRELIRAMDDEQESVRRAAVMALGTSGDSSALHPLVRALERRPELWREIAVALVALRGLEVAGSLCHLAVNGSESRVRRGAIHALGQILGPHRLSPDSPLNGYVDQSGRLHPLY